MKQGSIGIPEFIPSLRMHHGLHIRRIKMGWYKSLKAVCPQAVEGIFWKHSSNWKKNRPLCGARCRDGHACKAKAVVHPRTDNPLNGRCRMHGGLSTGAKTAEGKERCKEAARRGMLEYWKRKKSLRTGVSAVGI